MKKESFNMNKHWQEAFSKSIFKFNAYLKARYQNILDFLGNDLSDKVIVDLGAGDCALTSLILKKRANVIAVDNSSDFLAIGQKFLGEEKKIKTVEADANNVPLEDNVADFVVSADVIEHLEDYQGHVDEIARLLKTGGKLILSTPYRLGEIPAPKHTKEFYPDELKSMLVKDFENIEIKESHHIFWYSLYTFGRWPIFRRPIFKYLINILTLWFKKNPFLKDATRRGNKDYYTQITIQATRKE